MKTYAFLFIVALSLVTPSQSRADRREMMGDADCATIGKVRDRWSFDIKKISDNGSEIRWAGGIKTTIRGLNRAGRVVKIPLVMKAVIVGNPAFAGQKRVDDQMRKVTIQLDVLNPDFGVIETSVLTGPAGTYYTYALRPDRLRFENELAGDVNEAASLIREESFVEGVNHNLELFCNFNTGFAQ